MSKPELNENQYIAALNEALKNHPDYEKGMEIIGVPEGTSGEYLSGYNWKIPDDLKMRGVVA